jgi:hypothetical protein
VTAKVEANLRRLAREEHQERELTIKQTEAGLAVVMDFRVV